MMALFVLGLAISSLSASVLMIMLRILFRAQRFVISMGMNEALPLGRSSRLIVVGWSVALAIGLWLTIWAWGRM